MAALKKISRAWKAVNKDTEEDTADQLGRISDMLSHAGNYKIECIWSAMHAMAAGASVREACEYGLMEWDR